MAAQKVSLRELKRLTGLPLANLGMVATGKRRVTLQMLVKIITALAPTRAETRVLVTAAMADHHAEELVCLLG